MGLIEEIIRMRQTGMSEGEIISRLQEQGNTYKAISEAMSQSRIKQAIEEPEQLNPSVEQIPTYQPQEVPQPSMQQEQLQPQQEYAPQPQYDQNQVQDYQQQNYQPNYEYTPQTAALSSDTIMEISEQVVSEKLADVRKKLEKMSSFKAELETKTESIEDRLKRIEKIIDTLQTSVLRKVGDYVTNIEDIKHELIETQKTFAKVLGSKHQSKEHKKH